MGKFVSSLKHPISQISDFLESKNMKNSRGFRFLVLLCLISPTMALLSPMGVNFEVQALISIRESLEDPHGVLENWDKNSVDPCSWTMVTCSQDNLVIGLGTPSQNLSGTLSPAIGNLTNLQTVLLQNNNISGEIPPEIGKLFRLRTLDLSDNFLAGPIPSSLGQLKNLEYLRLNNNSLSGEFPQALANISSLSFLDFSYNNLSGPVPDFPSRTFSIVGNPLICPTGSEKECFSVSATFNSTFQNSSTTIISEKSKTGRFAMALGLSIGGGVLLILGFALFIWLRQRKNQQIFFDVNDEQKKEEESSIGNLRRFQLREIQAATENFSEKNIVGKGGFGIVYRGLLRDGGVVAVKRLRDGGAAGGEVQFQTEVEMISLAVHRNLLRLSGYCAASNERILVYPFMPNGSVASRLKEKPALDWAARKKIAVGAARGLLYLHEQCDPKIIHRDVKSANILLDESLDPIVGDFGLAKLLDHGDSHVSTAVRGTVGHIAPEYLSTGQSSDKTDVFGFGILLLELVSGLTSHKGAILDWVKKIREEKKVEMMVDKEMGGWDGVEVEEMVQVALLCTQFAPSQRPRMADVLRMLEGDGLADRWEASQKNAADPSSQKSKAAAQEFSSSERFSDLTDDSLMLVQAIELSGPR